MKPIINLFNNSLIKGWPSVFISLLVIYTAITYFLYSLNTVGIVLSLFLSIISFFLLKKYKLLPTLDKEIRNENRELKILRMPHKLAIISYFLFIMAGFLELITAVSERSLISPWEVVNFYFFLFYLLSLLLLIVIIKKEWLNDRQNSLLLSLQLLLSLLVAAIVYKIGYGFDTHIHQATMEIIAREGIISPKTPYYIGQYGLLVTIHKLSGISLFFLNKLLVPIAAALILPKLTFNLIRQISKDEEHIKIANWISVLVVMSFSFSLFYLSTPQNFSYLFLLLSLFAGLSDKTATRPFIFALAAAAIHPISGIPALIWSVWLIFKEYSHKLPLKWHKTFSALILSAGALFIPLSLFISSGAKLQNIQFSLQNILLPIRETLNFRYAGSENWLLNAVYILNNYYQLLVIALIIAGIYLYKNNKINFTAIKEKSYAWRGLMSINLSLLIAYILSSLVNFSDIINYEQGAFSKRILIIVVIFSSPFLVLSIYWLVRRIFLFKAKTVQVIWVIFALFFITTSLYLAYPRFDKYHNSRGYSTSQLDIEAVQKIEELATNDYLVLANQQVSAAALQVFGFTNYLNSPDGSIYFYPIPTGGRLYEYFLEMVYENPDTETMHEAMNFAGVNEGFLVVNKYWHDSGKIIKAAKLSANSFEELGNKDIFIFYYKR